MDKHSRIMKNYKQWYSLIKIGPIRMGQILL